jgi:hypothetical protein
MFNFLTDWGTYDQRKIDRYETDDLLVDTCAVSDSAQPYETAVAHPKYNDGKIVIVEMYESAALAQVGHDKWVATMTAETLPDNLRDVSTAGIAMLSDALGGNDWREKQSGE